MRNRRTGFIATSTLARTRGGRIGRVGAGRRRVRRGISLIEVLIASFVLAIGLVSLGALLEVGRYSVTETQKSDQSAACGRAALHELKTRGMVSEVNAVIVAGNGNPYSGALLVDPLGGAGDRMGLRVITPVGAGSAAFQSTDDLAVEEEGMARVSPKVRTDGSDAYWGHYSWLATLNPSRAETVTGAVSDLKTFDVSVAVCHMRIAKPGGPPAVAGTFFGHGVSGGRLDLGGTVKVRENQWILVVGGTPVQARWYRVAAANSRSAANGEIVSDRLQVIGPDWDTGALGAAVNVYVIESVIAVYNDTMALPQDPMWER